MNKTKGFHRDWFQFALGVVTLGVLALNPGAQISRAAESREKLRLAYFPNITHAPALVAVARGDFQRYLGPVALETKVVNAGPEAMQALLAGEIDIAYVGPSPAINTYLKSGRRALKVIAGACSGGAALVARSGTNITRVRDLDGKRVGVPQLGGTQDVSCRHFLAQAGLFPREKGGTVEIIPAKNPDILALFLRKQLDAAWVPEPWAARLVKEAGARLVVDERQLWPDGQFTTTVVVVRTAFLKAHPERVAALLRAHLQVTDWLRQHPDEGQQTVNAELKRLTGKALPADVLQAAWNRVAFTSEPNQSSIEAFARAAAEAGYLAKQDVDIAGLFEDSLRERLQRAASTQ
jgi:NitT/TauT family transport system substrate-binding protein